MTKFPKVKKLIVSGFLVAVSAVYAQTPHFGEMLNVPGPCVGGEWVPKLDESRYNYCMERGLGKGRNQSPEYYCSGWATYPYCTGEVGGELAPLTREPYNPKNNR